MTNLKPVPEMMQVGGYVISPIHSAEGARGLMIEFLPHPQQKTEQPVRVVLPEPIARQFLEKLSHALTFPRADPSAQSESLN